MLFTWLKCHTSFHIRLLWRCYGSCSRQKYGQKHGACVDWWGNHKALVIYVVLLQYFQLWFTLLHFPLVFLSYCLFSCTFFMLSSGRLLTGNLAPPPGYLDELTPHIHVTKVDGNTHKSFSFVDFHKILLNFATHLNGNSAGVWFVLAGLLENHGGLTWWTPLKRMKWTHSLSKYTVKDLI